MDTLENLRSKPEGAKDLKSVVTAMKAMAASNIVQYETAVSALSDYYHTVALGIIAYFKAEKIEGINEKKLIKKNKENQICAIVFGSDQGLVARFNDAMADFVTASLQALPEENYMGCGRTCCVVIVGCWYTCSEVIPRSE